MATFELDSSSGASVAATELQMQGYIAVHGIVEAFSLLKYDF